MKWAVAQGYRNDNPAGDAISAALPKNGGARRHQRALPFGEVSAALHRVKRSGAFEPTVLAFEFLVLTACRSGEVRLATWDEVDLESATWSVPANRMKSKRDHRVPLSARAQGVLQEAHEFADSSSLVFPSPRGGAISANTLSKLLRQLDIDAVPHGFRSSFRDWAAECSDAPREVCELILAHVNSDRVEAAYRRTDLFEQRRVLMEQWSAFLGDQPKAARIILSNRHNLRRYLRTSSTGHAVCIETPRRYSARSCAPPESNDINGFACRSALNPRAEQQTARAPEVPISCRSTYGRVRVHRRLVQPATVPLRHRISVTHKLRTEPATPRSPKSMTVHEIGATPTGGRTLA